MSRAEEIARGLVSHLRATLGAPALELVEPPVRLPGGFDTETYAVRLRHAPGAFGAPLVLRVLRAHHDPARVAREQIVQNTLADQGYPAPRVVYASADPAPLGAAFLLMERRPGMPLLSTRLAAMNRVLLDAQRRLHTLDASALVSVLGDAITFEGYLTALERRVASPAPAGLSALLGWLREHRPPADTPRVVCHGDLHPQNVLVHRGQVSGVLDWPNALVADAAFDVASTRNILRFVPAPLASTSRTLRWLAGAVQPILAARYLAGYRRWRPIAADRLAYYEVAAAMRALVRAAESRSRAAGGRLSNPLDRSPYAARLAAHVERITGVAIALPPVAGQP
jgi:aminoglycoside phosphotransferase (APT) family kinase protein